MQKRRVRALVASVVSPAQSLEVYPPLWHSVNPDIARHQYREGEQVACLLIIISVMSSSVCPVLRQSWIRIRSQASCSVGPMRADGGLDSVTCVGVGSGAGSSEVSASMEGSDVQPGARVET
ncbi:hypothetical protein NDU88_000261 [Pleurodeles waltl]|uniref:Uncharacterized protein n=1 Tax=Pleurodeles waltl TaxID=8319 RepID=A0AAV7LU35_PLEWA|nr:hypothetical protein NDU88_000261 [Pleurodeles waltl]